MPHVHDDAARALCTLLPEVAWRWGKIAPNSACNASHAAQGIQGGDRCAGTSAQPHGGEGCSAPGRQGKSSVVGNVFVSHLCVLQGHCIICK